MAKNAYLDKIKEEKQACFDVGEEMGIQKVWEARRAMDGDWNG